MVPHFWGKRFCLRHVVQATVPLMPRLPLDGVVDKLVVWPHVRSVNSLTCKCQWFSPSVIDYSLFLPSSVFLLHRISHIIASSSCNFFPQYLIILFLNMFGIMNWNKIHENIAASCPWVERTVVHGTRSQLPHSGAVWDGSWSNERGAKEMAGFWERVVETWMEMLFELLLLMVERFFVFVMLRRFSFLLVSIATWWYDLFISLSNCSASGIVSRKAASENASPQQTPGKCR